MTSGTLFSSVFSSTAAAVSPGAFLACVACSLVLGYILSCMYLFRSQASTSFTHTLALLPAIVCVVIMMVNGNVGTGVAVAGAFSLVRFRSAPGTAKEIGAIFLAMGTGLICGMGYLAYATLFALVVGCSVILYQMTGFGAGHTLGASRALRVTVPEDLDYTSMFDDLLDTYCRRHELIAVKSSNMGSLFKLSYSIELADPIREKEFIDQIRCRNGNLEVAIMREEAGCNEL